MPAALRTERRFALDVLAASPAALGQLASELWHDGDFVLSVLELDGSAFEFAAPRLRADRELVLSAVARCAAALAHADDALRADRAFLLDAVERSGAALAHCLEPFRGDGDFVVDALRRNWEAAAHAPAELWAERAFALAALAVDRRALGHASEALRSDRDFVLQAVGARGSSLEFASAALRADREVLEAAMREDVRALGMAAEALRGDRAVALAAVSLRGQALRYAAEALRADREVVLAAVEDDGEALEHASPELRADRAFVLSAVQRDGSALAHAAAELRADPAFVLQAAERQGCAIQFAADSLLQDREFVLAAVARNAFALGFAPAQLRGARGFVLAAVRANADALRFAPPFLQADPGFQRAAAQVGAAAAGEGEAGEASDGEASDGELFDFCELEELEVPPAGPEVLPAAAEPQGASALFDFDELDELDKLQAGVGGGDSDGGAAARPAARGGVVDWFFALDEGCAEPGESTGQPVTDLADATAAGDDPHLTGRAALKVELRRLGLPMEPGAEVQELRLRLRQIRSWRALGLPQLAGLCAEHGVCAAVDAASDEPARRRALLRRLVTHRCAEAWRTKGVPVARFASVEWAAQVVRRLARLEAASEESLEAEHRRLGLPLWGLALRRELEGPLRAVAVWDGLSMAELEAECLRRAGPEGLGRVSSRLDEQERRRQLLELLLVTLCEEVFDGRGIPVRRLGSTKAAMGVAEEWERLHKLSLRSLRDECLAAGLPPEPCLDWCGRGDLVGRLRRLALWQRLPFAELRRDCEERGLPARGPAPGGAAAGGGERDELLDMLLADTFADVFEGALGVPVPARELQSLRAASFVHERFERLAAMGAGELAAEFRALLGVPPDAAVPAPQLLQHLRDLAVWAVLPPAGLEDACRRLAADGHGELLAVGHGEAERQRALLECLRGTLCVRLYEARGISLRRVGSTSAAGRLLAQWERADALGDAAVADACRSRGVPAPPEAGAMEWRARLRTVLTLGVLPMDKLWVECQTAGVQPFTKMGAGELIKRIVAAKWGAPEAAREGEAHRRQQERERRERERQSQEARPHSPRRQGQRQEAQERRPNGSGAPGAAQQGQERARTRPPAAAPPPLGVALHLETLQLAPDAGLDDVKRAYRRLALRRPVPSESRADRCLRRRGEQVTRYSSWVCPRALRTVDSRTTSLSTKISPTRILQGQILW